ncbi:MAG: hypothetical protein KTR25_09145 [Myxococcales bacterium]|nr:hypothetical protein [Myxococcales bacterium]
MVGERNNKEHLSGKVVIETLGEKDEKGRFRGGDHRGEVAMIVAGSVMEYVELVEFKEGTTRAFCYHEEFIKSLYVINGPVVAALAVVDSPLERLEVELSAGQILTINPGVAHAFLALGRSWVLSMGKGSDPFVDRHIYRDLGFSHGMEEEGV